MGIPYTTEGIGIRMPPPRATIALVIANIVVYAITTFEYGFFQVSERWLWWGAFVPIYMSNPLNAYRILTSMFMHANLFHIFFNMLYLYNFGRQVESVLGVKRYLALYFLSGVAADIFHTAFIPIEGPLAAIVPAIGASGAISGVLGAYLLLFPGSRLSMCFFYMFFPICITTNAAAYLIFWFAMQVLQGYAGASAGVAVFAHAGGFLGGMALLPYVLDKERHRLLRSLTASRRALKYLFLGSAGLGRLAKAVLVALTLAVAAGGVYSAFAASKLAVPVKVLQFNVKYEVYCLPNNVLCSAGYDEEAVVVRLDGKPRLVTPIASDAVRVLYNRLNAVAALYDRGRAGSTAAVKWRGPAEVMGVRVAVNLNMDAVYDKNGLIEEAEGSLETSVLACRLNVCVISGVGRYNFTIKSLYSGERSGALAAMVMLLSYSTIAICALAIDNTLRKARQLEIVA